MFSLSISRSTYTPGSTLGHCRWHPFLPLPMVSKQGVSPKPGRAIPSAAKGETWGGTEGNSPHVGEPLTGVPPGWMLQGLSPAWVQGCRDQLRACRELSQGLLLQGPDGSREPNPARRRRGGLWDLRADSLSSRKATGGVGRSQTKGQYQNMATWEGDGLGAANSSAMFWGGVVKPLPVQ